MQCHVLRTLTGDAASEFLVIGQVGVNLTIALEVGLGKVHWGYGGWIPSPVVPFCGDRLRRTPRVLLVRTRLGLAIFPDN